MRVFKDSRGISKTLTNFLLHSRVEENTARILESRNMENVHSFTNKLYYFVKPVDLRGLSLIIVQLSRWSSGSNRQTNKNRVMNRQQISFFVCKREGKKIKERFPTLRRRFAAVNLRKIISMSSIHEQLLAISTRPEICNDNVEMPVQVVLLVLKTSVFHKSRGRGRRLPIELMGCDVRTSTRQSTSCSCLQKTI